MGRFLCVLTMLGQFASAAMAGGPDIGIVRGEALARTMCAEGTVTVIGNLQAK